MACSILLFLTLDHRPSQVRQRTKEREIIGFINKDRLYYMNVLDTMSILVARKETKAGVTWFRGQIQSTYITKSRIPKTDGVNLESGPSLNILGKLSSRTSHD